MDSKVFPLEYFYDESVTNFYIVFTNTTTGITVALIPVYFYVIFTQSKQLGNFKWFLVNHSIWYLSLDLAMCYFKPLVLNPAAAGFILGPLRGSGYYRTSIFFVFLMCTLAIFSIGGGAITLAYRYAGLFPGLISTLFASKISFIVYFLIHFVFSLFIGIIAIIFIGKKREDIIADALNYSPALEKFVHESSFIFFNKDVARGPIAILFYALVLVVCMIIIVGVPLFHKIRHTKTVSLTSKIHKNLLFSAIGQATISFLLLFCPLMIFTGAMVYEQPYSGPRFMIVLCGMSMHAMIEMIVTMCVVAPYRRFFVRLFQKFFGKTEQRSTAVSEVSLKLSLSYFKAFHNCKNHYLPKMDPKDFPLEYFYDESITNFYIVFTRVTTVVTVLLIPIYFFVILTQSKALGNFKWFLLNNSIWYLFLDLAMCYFKPLILCPAAAGIVLGPPRQSGSYKSSTVLVFVILNLAMLSVGGATITLAYRYAGLFPGWINVLFASKMSFIFYLLFHSGFVLFFTIMMIQFFIKEREEIIVDALNYSPALQKFTYEPSFIFFDKNIVRTPLAIVFYTLVFIMLGTICVGVPLLYRIRYTKTVSLTSKIQKNLLLSATGQAMISFLLLFCPLMVFTGTVVYERPYSGPQLMIILCAMSMHAMTEMIITMCGVAPYR
ncbi:hypothetical protein FO519_005150, partial [Halicephalobus sp. NKZ332]